MKLLIIIVPLIAVVIVDCLNYPDVSRGQNTVDQAQNSIEEAKESGLTFKAHYTNENQNSEGQKSFDYEEENQNNLDEPEGSISANEYQNIKEDQYMSDNRLYDSAEIEDFDSTEVDHHLMKENNGNNMDKQRSTLETKITDLEINLGSMQENITGDNMKLSLELKSMKENMIRSNSNMDSKLNTINKNQGCPTGFFRLISSSQCFRLFTDTTRNWAQSEEKCRTEGLMLAEPEDPVSVRMHMVEKNGINKFAWVGGKGDGSYIRQLRSGNVISSSSPFWVGSDPGSKVTSSYCLMILSQDNSSYRYTPYHSATCAWAHAYALCELVTE